MHCHCEASCSGRSIDLSRSVEAHILCESFISCIGSVILCGSGACSLHCEEASSCENVVVDASFAASFRCIGNCEFNGIPDDFGEGAIIPLPSTCPGGKTPVLSFENAKKCLIYVFCNVVCFRHRKFSSSKCKKKSFPRAKC